MTTQLCLCGLQPIAFQSLCDFCGYMFVKCVVAVMYDVCWLNYPYTMMDLDDAIV